MHGRCQKKLVGRTRRVSELVQAVGCRGSWAWSVVLGASETEDDCSCREAWDDPTLSPVLHAIWVSCTWDLMLGIRQSTLTMRAVDSRVSTGQQDTRLALGLAWRNGLGVCAATTSPPAAYSRDIHPTHDKEEEARPWSRGSDGGGRFQGHTECRILGRHYAWGEVPKTRRRTAFRPRHSKATLSTLYRPISRRCSPRPEFHIEAPSEWPWRGRTQVSRTDITSAAHGGNHCYPT